MKAIPFLGFRKCKQWRRTKTWILAFFALVLIFNFNILFSVPAPFVRYYLPGGEVFLAQPHAFWPIRSDNFVWKDGRKIHPKPIDGVCGNQIGILFEFYPNDQDFLYLNKTGEIIRRGDVGFESALSKTRIDEIETQYIEGKSVCHTAAVFFLLGYPPFDIDNNPDFRKLGSPSSKNWIQRKFLN